MTTHLKIFSGYILCLVAVSLPLSAANLLPNGNFEQSNNGRVLYWEIPDGLTASWSSEKGRGRILKMDSRMELSQVKEFRAARKKNPALLPPKPQLATGEKYSSLGGDEGALFDSGDIKVLPGRRYRLTVTAKGTGTPWVFIKGFMMHPRQKRLVDAYQTRLHCGPLSEEEWRSFSMDFNPTAHSPQVSMMKVRFMVYWPPAVCYFDDIRLELLPPQPQ